MQLPGRFSLVIIMGLLSFHQGYSQDTAPIEGDWIGTLTLGATDVRIVFHISTNGEGQLTSTMDSPDQGANGIPTSKTSFVDGTLSIEAAGIGGTFIGKLEGEAVTGTWKQGAGTWDLDLKRMTEPITYNRPQEPERPLPYKEEVVRYMNEEGGFELEGTLTLPDSDGSFPAVVLISGSGPQDRDESLMGHKPFYIIADYLTRNGIAVLRYDDRGVGNSGGDFGSSTTLDFVTDVEAAIQYLQSRSDINSSQIGLIGHSEGGLIAPIVATQPNHNAAFVVLLAGPGLTGRDILATQTAKMVRLQGVPDQFVVKLTEINYRLYDSIAASEAGKAETNLREELATIRGELSAMELTWYGLTEDREDQLVAQLASTWMQTFMVLDPAEYLEKLQVPVLSLIGEKDVQVLPEENTEAIDAAIKKGGNSDYTSEILPGLNHLFQNAETGLPAEYAQIEETFSEDVLELITEWIKRRV